MAMFGKQNSSGSGAASTPPESKGASQGPDGSLSIIGAGMTITGDLESTGVVKIEGRVNGSIRSARQVFIGKQGHVHGDIDTREAVIAGTVEGVITASERAEVQGTAQIKGDLHAKTISVLEGARIDGAVKMGSSAPAAAAPRPQQSSSPNAPVPASH